MKLVILILAIFCLNHSNGATIKSKPFVNLKHYSVSGVLSLPYAEVSEPFRAWFDVEQYASRIDYYDGEYYLVFFYCQKLFNKYS